MKLHQKFIPINKAEHLIKTFDCGKPDMNFFLSRFAIKHAKLGLSKTFVLPIDEDSNKKPIAAYYTLAISTINRQDIPTQQSLPHYPIPVTILARLAVDIKFQGKHIGEKTLIYALRHTVRLCDEGLPTYGLILDVLDDNALKFYQRFNFFHNLTDNPMRLFVPLNSLRKI